jgi:hypothetical protein
VVDLFCSSAQKLGGYEALLETIEILGDNKILRALMASQKDFKSSRVFTHAEVWKD